MPKPQKSDFIPRLLSIAPLPLRQRGFFRPIHIFSDKEYTGISGIDRKRKGKRYEQRVYEQHLPTEFQKSRRTDGSNGVRRRILSLPDIGQRQRADTCDCIRTEPEFLKAV